MPAAPRRRSPKLDRLAALARRTPEFTAVDLVAAGVELTRQAAHYDLWTWHRAGILRRVRKGVYAWQGRLPPAQTTIAAAAAPLVLPAGTAPPARSAPANHARVTRGSRRGRPRRGPAPPTPQAAPPPGDVTRQFASGVRRLVLPQLGGAAEQKLGALVGRLFGAIARNLVLSLQGAHEDDVAATVRFLRFLQAERTREAQGRGPFPDAEESA